MAFFVRAGEKCLYQPSRGLFSKVVALDTSVSLKTFTPFSQFCVPYSKVGKVRESYFIDDFSIRDSKASCCIAWTLSSTIVKA